jgi:ferritin-like metal-binding protein YciE
MDSTKSKLDSGSNLLSKSNKGNSNGNSRGLGKGMQVSQLMKLFEEELKDIYWAENAITKAIPKMVKNATSKELIEGLNNHLLETVEQVKRIERVFEILGKKATAIKCEAMAGLIKEAEVIMEDCKEGAMCDAGIISAAQKVKHYKIATYGTLRQFAETLDLDETTALLAATLEEEKAADEELSFIATSTINIEAAEVLA